MNAEITKLVDGGKYSADLITVFIDDQEMGSWYFDGCSDTGYADECEDYIHSCLQDPTMIDNVLKIEGSRALQANKLTEALVITIGELDQYKYHNYFSKEPTKGNPLSNPTG